MRYVVIFNRFSLRLLAHTLSNSHPFVFFRAGNPECRLQCLRMSDANIDDGECARFVEVLMRNIHLKELDMSCNLLGKDENLNAVQPDFVTGGESLSELIRHESCPIQILNVSCEVPVP